MKNTLITLILILASITVKAQDLHIFYDAFKDSIAYQVNGQVVEQPIVRKGARIVLHVDNYNDYLYQVEVTTAAEDYQVPTTSVTSLLLGGSDSGIGQLKDFLGGGQGVLSDLFSGEGTEEDFSMGFGSDDEEDGWGDSESYELEEAYASFSGIMKEIGEIEEEIEDLNKSLQSAITRAEHTQFMKEEVTKLKTNTALAPNTVRRLMLEYLEKILDLDQGGSLDLESLFELAETQQVYGKVFSDYEQQIQRLELKANEAQAVALMLNEYGLAQGPKSNVENTLNALSGKKETLQKNAAELGRLVPTLSEQSISNLADVRYLYEELKDHRFSKQVVIDPEADITTLNINLAPIDSLSTRVRARHLTPVKVRSYGGLRVNASVGISFSRLFNQPKNYLVRDGVLFGDELDAFSPVVTSFVHFYGESRKQTTIAGTLGLGLGLGSETGVGLQNYFLGPSLVIGKRQRVVLTTGLTGTKVNRLALGLQEGDPYNESIVPLKSVYELGFFFGLSFNVLGN